MNYFKFTFEPTNLGTSRNFQIVVTTGSYIPTARFKYLP